MALFADGRGVAGGYDGGGVERGGAGGAGVGGGWGWGVDGDGGWGVGGDGGDVLF